MSFKPIIPKVEKITKSKIHFSKDHIGKNFEKLLKKFPTEALL